jgi:hypothetical protein
MTFALKNVSAKRSQVDIAPQALDLADERARTLVGRALEDRDLVPTHFMLPLPSNPPRSAAFTSKPYTFIRSTLRH